MCERDHRGEHARGHRGERATQRRGHGRHLAGQRDCAAARGIGSYRWCDAAEHGDGGDAVLERGHPGARQRVRSAAGQPDDAELVGTEHVGNMGHVGGPVADPLVAVGIAEPRPGTLDQNDPQPEFLGGAPPDDRELPATARGAVEPEHDGTGRIAELGVAEASPVWEEERTLGARRLAAGDARWMAPRVGKHERMLAAGFTPAVGCVTAVPPPLSVREIQRYLQRRYRRRQAIVLRCKQTEFDQLRLGEMPGQLLPRLG